jgi:hypothetical protein
MAMEENPVPTAAFHEILAWPARACGFHWVSPEIPFPSGPRQRGQSRL